MSPRPVPFGSRHGACPYLRAFGCACNGRSGSVLRRKAAMDDTKLIAATLTAGLLQARAITQAAAPANMATMTANLLGGPPANEAAKAAVELYNAVLSELQAASDSPSSASP